ncbi:SRPBCC domain-containing protein [Burkholderia vietnamiensis]|uniref:SRPBCC domain-containing protein n=1 Tax=Burkholderia vietnamiensis TaxID=60552 RepID=UPI0030C868E9
MVAGERSLAGQFQTLDVAGYIVNNLCVQNCSGVISTDYEANMGLRGLLLKGIAVIVVGIIGTLFFLHDDISAHAETFIDRTPADVWKVVSNSTAYPDWNPFITRVDGEFREGETIRIVLGTGPDAMIFNPTVLIVHPEQDLCWRGSVWIRGVFDGTHCIHLTAVTGGTRLEQTESFSGLLVGRLTKDVIEETQRNFEAMNAAVQQRVDMKTP